MARILQSQIHRDIPPDPFYGNVVLGQGLRENFLGRIRGLNHGQFRTSISASLGTYPASFPSLHDQSFQDQIFQNSGAVILFQLGEEFFLGDGLAS